MQIESSIKEIYSIISEKDFPLSNLSNDTFQIHKSVKIKLIKEVCKRCNKIKICLDSVSSPIFPMCSECFYENEKEKDICNYL